MSAARFVNPFTDFGFKKLFGEEASKPLLKDFLNALLPTHARIAELSFKNRERLGASDAERRAIFDLHCEAENGEQFIVEMQKAKQNFFKDRSVYYATFPIQEQAQRGDWDYRLAPSIALEFSTSASTNEAPTLLIRARSYIPFS